MPKNQQVILKQHPEGGITADHFDVIQTESPELKPKHFILQNHFLSMDAGFRQWMNENAGDGYLPGMQIGSAIQSIVIGEVVESDNDDFPISSIVLARTAWEEYSLLDGGDLCSLLEVDPEMDLYHYVGVLGTTGLTAYFGLFDIGQPKQGDTLLVSTAAGAVGNVVCQLGKKAGCRVVGMTGSDKKCDWLKTEIGVDATINYNADPLCDQIARTCPTGVDIFFDNVGGSQLDAALQNISDKARIVLCGAMSQYENNSPEPIYNSWPLITHRARAEGFMFSDYQEQYPAAIKELADMMKSGSLKSFVNIYEGISSTPQAFSDMIGGTNRGKCLVKLI